MCYSQSDVCMHVCSQKLHRCILGGRRRKHRAGKHRGRRLKRRRREQWEKRQFEKKPLGLGDLPPTVLHRLYAYLPDARDQLAWLQANRAAARAATPPGREGVPRAGIKALVERIRQQRVRAAAEEDAAKRRAHDRRYASAVQDAKDTARGGGGYAEDLVEVSDYEGDENYIRALAAYKQARARGARGQGFKAVARQFRIPAVRLQRMYERDCDRQRRAWDSSDDDSGPC